MEFLEKLPWEPSADLQLEMCYRQAGIVNWRCRWGDRHSGSSVVGVSGWLVPGTGGCSAPAGMVPGRWVCVKAVIAARRRSVPSKRERQAEESSASCLDVLVSGPWWRLRPRLSWWRPLVCTETEKAHGMRLWPCGAAYEALHGLVPAHLTRVTVLPVSVRGLLRTLSSGPTTSCGGFSLSSCPPRTRFRLDSGSHSLHSTRLHWGCLA